MLHIYRQITALKRCAPVVIAQRREQTERFPFEAVQIVPKPATHLFRRFWFRQVRDKPWQISRAEVRTLLNVLSKHRAQVLHIYFGQIAVHLLPLIRAWQNPTIVSFHGADVMVDMNKPAYLEVTRQMLDAVKLILVRSDSLRRALVDLGCKAEKIEIQRTGIPVQEFQFRERSFPSTGEWRLVQAGRLIEKKGLPVSLRAFATFLTRHPNATLTSHTFFCTRARLATTETRKAFRTQCSKPWPPACRRLRQITAAFLKQSRMASPACSCPSAITKR